MLYEIEAFLLSEVISIKKNSDGNLLHKNEFYFVSII